MSPRKTTIHNQRITPSPSPSLSRAIHRALLGITLAAPLGAALVAPAAWAQTASELQFNIPAGPLESALTQFASSAGITVSFEPGYTHGRHASGLQGRYTADAALHRLLAGSGLQAIRLANGSYSLLPAKGGTRRWTWGRQR